MTDVSDPRRSRLPAAGSAPLRLLAVWSAGLVTVFPVGLGGVGNDTWVIPYDPTTLPAPARARAAFMKTHHPNPIKLSLSTATLKTVKMKKQKVVVLRENFRRVRKDRRIGTPPELFCAFQVFSISQKEQP